jgi:hypothetical protein
MAVRIVSLQVHNNSITLRVEALEAGERAGFLEKVRGPYGSR